MVQELLLHHALVEHEVILVAQEAGLDHLLDMDTLQVAVENADVFHCDDFVDLGEVNWVAHHNAQARDMDIRTLQVDVVHDISELVRRTRLVEEVQEGQDAIRLPSAEEAHLVLEAKEVVQSANAAEVESLHAPVVAHELVPLVARNPPEHPRTVQLEDIQMLTAMLLAQAQLYPAPVFGFAKAMLVEFSS